jgi:hypothetical protein
MIPTIKKKNHITIKRVEGFLRNDKFSQFFRHDKIYHMDAFYRAMKIKCKNDAAKRAEKKANPIICSADQSPNSFIKVKNDAMQGA